MNFENVIELRIKHYYLMQSTEKRVKLSERQTSKEEVLSHKDNGINKKPENHGKAVLKRTA
jgi:hypothetical protein